MKNVLIFLLCTLFATIANSQVVTDSVKIEWGSNPDTSRLFQGAPNIWFIVAYQSGQDGTSNVTRTPVGDTTALYQALVGPVVDNSRQLAIAMRSFLNTNAAFRELRTRNTMLTGAGLVGMFDLLRNQFAGDALGAYKGKIDNADAAVTIEQQANGNIRIKWGAITKTLNVISESMYVIRDYPANNQETFLIRTNERTLRNYEGTFTITKKR